MEKTKSKKGKKIAKVVLLALSFILTAVITFNVTLAWFYDEDWASSMVTMAGTVGIELRDDANTTIYAPNDPNNTSLTSGSGNLHFYVLTDKAYPGQSIDVKASVFNNGGDSKQNGKDGSPAYIRARFVVYTDIGNTTGGIADDPQNLMNSRAIYNYLLSLITEQNADSDIPYTWQYHTTQESYPLKNADASGTTKYYYNGTAYASSPTIASYESYYYLCYKTGATVKNKNDQNVTVNNDKVLKPLAVGENTAFLWNSHFVIPWTLTNESADKMIFVAVQFQAIQTFIPQVNLGSTMDGIISAGVNGDNQVDPTECTYDSKAVQTVFNSSNFGAIDLKIYDTDGTTVLYDFGNGQYNNSTSQTNGGNATA